MTPSSPKKELRRPDAFVAAGQRASAWTAQHRLGFAAAGVGVLLLLLGLWGLSVRNQSRDRAAAAQLARAWRIVESGEVTRPAADGEVVAPGETGAAAGEGEAATAADGDTSDEDEEDDDEDAEEAAARRAAARRRRVPPALRFASHTEQWQAALQLALPLQDKPRIGVPASLLCAELHSRLEAHDAARAIFARLVKALPTHAPLYFLAAERLAYAHERTPDRSAAIATWAPLADDDQLFYADFAQFAQARLYQADNRPAEARDRLEHLEAAHPSSPLADEARSLLEVMGPAPAAEPFAVGGDAPSAPNAEGAPPAVPAAVAPAAAQAPAPAAAAP